MTATLTKPRRTVNEDGITGYAVTMHSTKETSERVPVEIVSRAKNGVLMLGIDREVTLHVNAFSNRVCIFSDRGAEMMNHEMRMDVGDTIVIHPVGSAEPFEREATQP